ncbi:hydratase [Clostridium sp. MCC353]|uniref:hydratase n=1 Tax=Clostridium sp. MCC353 TaxID=2592646 RepID=UPI001C023612|nr:hydratase [Clostridium sp. MCC353]MBT9777622.1 hydratase [Clostridium sp. MCC353]
MIKLTDHGVFLTPDGQLAKGCDILKEDAVKNTMAYSILKAHNQSGSMEQLCLKFDALVSPDNNYVNILQTARAGGLTKFPVPYVLSNCHHTLCAVGGTINEDDHVFGLGNARKYGGIFVPPYRAVLHQYMREMMAGAGKMILGSDSHTRYGGLGTMGIGEGGGEVVKQLLSKTYDMKMPPVVAVKLTGSPKPGVGPQDVALALIGATFKNGFVKNKVLEFLGEGIHGLSVEYRMGIDVMTTESAALSSIWCTDGKVKDYLSMHGRESDYREMKPSGTAYYDAMIEIDLSSIECMMALPFHPSNVCSIREFKENPEKYLQKAEEEGQKIKGNSGKKFELMNKLKDGNLQIDQALVSGCSGGMFENIAAMADILRGCAINGNQPGLGINPASQPVYLDLTEKGIAGELTVAGAVLRPAICGPCFGVTDVPADNQLSIRHTTRNYPNREGSKPGQNQMAAVILMDARSIAATIRNGGALTAASELDVTYRNPQYHFNPEIYKNQVFDHFGKGNPEEKLQMGPNIADWPEMYPLTRHLLLKTAGAYEGSVTTDELIPSGDASSYRSNPEKISEYMMMSRDPGYVKRAKEIREMDRLRRQGNPSVDPACHKLLAKICGETGCGVSDITIGSLMAGTQIGDGSSREQAASCQKVLGGYANLANEYATKRYRSNLINWGILPLLTEERIGVENGDWLLIKDVASAVESGAKTITAELLDSETGTVKGSVNCTLGELTKDERMILLAGCLINFYGEK